MSSPASSAGSWVVAGGAERLTRIERLARVGIDHPHSLWEIIRQLGFVGIVVVVVVLSAEEGGELFGWWSGSEMGDCCCWWEQVD